ncbi:MAG: hypothetical protein OEQ25_17785 [Gammaproteobacteria bacterium]|nr:hypothetical protein [Gammaproteobacteria bacterium]MDH3508994.1 hypothetical protein [Gammaproteobacteria bacterium]
MLRNQCVALLSLLALAWNSQVSSQTVVEEIPRTAEGTPRLDGIWQALSEANWDIRPHAAGHALLPELGTFTAIHPGLGIVEGGALPYQEWAAARQQENFANRLELDPEGKCFMPGVPRATYMPFPFQILQTPDLVMIAYQYANAVRTIHMNDPGPAPNNSWMGWSVGRWEGDTLVVNVTDMSEQTWFDRAGNFHSEALRVVERYTVLSPNHLLYEATIEDPDVFTRPWSISLPLYRRVEENIELMEFKCVEFVEEKIYGHLRKQSDE